MKVVSHLGWCPRFRADGSSFDMGSTSWLDRAACGKLLSRPRGANLGNIPTTGVLHLVAIGKCVGWYIFFPKFRHRAPHLPAVDKCGWLSTFHSAFRAVCVCLLVLCCGLQAQVGNAPTPKPPAARRSSPTPGQTAPHPWTRYCLKTAGFCFEYPVKWTNLGPIYGGAGVVVAEPTSRRPQKDWNQITATALELPEPAAGSERPELDELIERVLSPPPGATIQTIQRRNAMIGGHPAQVVTVEVQEQGKPAATELVAFVDADDIIYSMALRCAPAELKRLQPVFEHLLRSWREIPVE